MQTQPCHAKSSICSNNLLLGYLESLNSASTSRLTQAVNSTGKRIFCTLALTIGALHDSGIHATWGALKLSLITVRQGIRILSCGKYGTFANHMTLGDVKEHARQSLILLLVGSLSSATFAAMALTPVILCSRQYMNTVTLPLLFWCTVAFAISGGTLGHATSPDKLVERYRKRGLIMSDADWKKNKEESAKLQLSRVGDTAAVQLNALDAPGSALELKRVDNQPAIQLKRVDKKKERKKP